MKSGLQQLKHNPDIFCFTGSDFPLLDISEKLDGMFNASLSPMTTHHLHIFGFSGSQLIADVACHSNIWKNWI